MKIIEYPIPHDASQEGFGYLYDKTTDTIHLTGGAFHWELMRQAPVDMNRDVIFAGYVNQEYPDTPGVETHRKSISGHDWLSPEDEQKVTDALKDYLFKDPDYLNFGRVREGAANIIQIFDAEPDSEYIKALYFVDQGTLYWWFTDDMDGSPTHIMALNSFGFKWEDLNSMKIIPILGGNIKSSYDPPEVVSWVGNARQQQKAEDLLHQLMSALNGNEYFGKKAKIVDVETQVGLGGYGGEIRRPVVYIPEQDTMYIGSSDSSHASVIAEIDKQFLEEYPQGHGYSGDDRWEHYGYWELYIDNEVVDEQGNPDIWAKTLMGPQITNAQRDELVSWAKNKVTKKANIYDPIEKELDHHAFKNGEPRQSVVSFIKRLYGRALKAEYGIENPELFIDLYITGSLTTFQYSETSDCDVSVFPNYERFAQSFDEDASKTRKRLVALSIEHIDGTFLPGTTHPLQFFVVADGIKREDLYAPGLRSAWSVFDKMWVVPPERERSHEVAAEFPDAYSRASSIADKMKDALDHDPDSARELWKQVHQKRQLDQRAGLGDYSEGNIVYKWLLHEGLFDRIKNELHEYIAKRAMAERTWILRVVDPSTVNHNPSDSRGELGYPVIADLSTYQAFIGPLGAHHADVMNAVIPNWASQNPDYIENRYTWINLWPPGTYGWGRGGDDWYVGWYQSGKKDGELSDQLAEWLRQNDPRGTKEAAADGADEIRWGYNGNTGEVVSVKAWHGGNVYTHMDMAAKWLGLNGWEDLEDMMEANGNSFENFFFGYADWNRAEHKVENIQVYSLDLASDDWKLSPADMKLIEDAINTEAPTYMEA